MAQNERMNEQEADPAGEKSDGETLDSSNGTTASNGAKASQKPKRPRRGKTPKPDRAKSAPWLAERNVLELLERAAKHVGLESAEELANLVVDSGVVAMPPSDEITDAYTLKDLGTRLWGTMQEQPKSSRASWFHGLSPVQKKAVIVTLRDQGFSSHVIAGELKVDLMEVIRTWNKHADDLGAQVVGIRLNTIAGNLQIVAERAQQGAMQKEDFSAMWRIQKEMTTMLQSLGIVDQAIHRVEHTHKFDEQKQVELNALLELEDKKRRRGEEVKRIRAVDVEVIPPELNSLDEA